jgi:hypothetical protein
LQRKALKSLYSQLAKSNANRDLRTEIEWEETIILVGNDNKYFESLTTLQSLRKAYQELSSRDLCSTYRCLMFCRDVAGFFRLRARMHGSVLHRAFSAFAAPSIF